ncbi:MAG: alpha-D-ribose 1-methylphosphonate 5-triphosphate diphosphatase [Rhodospirillaceae bacterium]|nr:alpha-D-ribose 1-methylphosphonate 5-triphosphate diphosphatase [Rhodospirillaceae bacterium]
MTGETVLTNARVVLRDQVVEGTVCIEDGLITAVDDGVTSVPGAIDLEGDLLVPGLVELHTDNLEKHFVPRPGVIWPAPVAAALAHDAQIVGSGITTVFDAMCVGDYHAGGLRRDIFHRASQAVCEAAATDLFRADHFLHMRCEVSDPTMEEMLTPWIDNPRVRFLSVMDHTPGQRQWTKVEKFREFNSLHGWSDEEVAAVVAKRQRVQEEWSEPNRALVVAAAKARGLPIASHDDTTVGHVEEAVEDGLTVAEFPTTLEAALAAHDAGLLIVMGAPNVVRGGSHSGNVSALDLADAGLLDGLSSDYVPASLLHAALLLAGRDGLDLAAAIAMVTRAPAEMAGLTDRGQIAPGLRADLAQVRPHAPAPQVRTVWSQGRRVF